jgi:hypothetical protein
VAAPANHTYNGVVSAAVHCFPEPDYLLELCASVGPPTWVDPMLEELVASLVVSWPARAPATRGSLALATISLDAKALLVDSRSPTKTA